MKHRFMYALVTAIGALLTLGAGPANADAVGPYYANPAWDQSCAAATFNYTFTGGSSSGLSGTINLTRVGPVPPGCTS